MSDLVLEILKDIQGRLARVETTVGVLPQLETTTSVLPRLEAEVATLVRAATGLQQDVRMIRASVNDMAHTRVSSGEVEALHFELDQLRTEVREHETRLNMLEHRGPAE